MTFVSPHAIDRFIERVAPVSREEAKARILASSKAIETARLFGCSVVLCGDGTRLILEKNKIVTVYGRHMLPRQCRKGERA